MKLGKLGVWSMLDRLSPQAVVLAVQRCEKLGYSVLWLPEAIGPDPFVRASWLLANTEKLILATGIANIYHRQPGAMVSAQKTLAEQSSNRFLLGLGVSHQVLVEGVRGLKYAPPLTAMRNYLDEMDAAPDNTAPDGVKNNTLEMPRVLAALGPKMLALAREKGQGAHPYFMMPNHTRLAREILGPDAWLCVEQKVVLETDAVKARAVARQTAQFYLGLPNYQRGWKFSGLAESDCANGGSDRFIDATFAWGSIEDIKRRLQEHFDAGASHVCIQPINPDGSRDLHWEVLEALAPA